MVLAWQHLDKQPWHPRSSYSKDVSFPRIIRHLLLQYTYTRNFKFKVVFLLADIFPYLLFSYQMIVSYLDVLLQYCFIFILLSVLLSCCYHIYIFSFLFFMGGGGGGRSGLGSGGRNPFLLLMVTEAVASLRSQ